MNMFHTTKTTPALLAAFTLGSLAATPAAFAQDGGEAEGDGAPHVAVAQAPDGTLEVEFEINFGLDETQDPPRITLDVSNFDPFAGGFATIPVNTTDSPNDDLGFVSEIEGSGEEGGTLNSQIGVRLIEKDDNFQVFFNDAEILTNENPVFDLGFFFDTHPIWTIASDDPDFTGFADASLELFNQTSGDSLQFFDVRLDTQPVPEPASAAIAGALGTLLLRRRRRTA